MSYPPVKIRPSCFFIQEEYTALWQAQWLCRQAHPTGGRMIKFATMLVLVQLFAAFVIAPQCAKNFQKQKKEE